MKITAFILSILLSTAALAKNHTGQYYGDADITEQIEHVAADGQTSVLVEVHIDDVAEAVDDKFNRGEITEDQRNSLYSSIEQFEAAHGNKDEVTIQYLIKKECMECLERQNGRPSAVGFGLFAGAMAGIIMGFITTAATNITIAFPIAIPVGAVIGVVAVKSKIFDDPEKDDVDACARICSLENPPQQ